MPFRLPKKQPQFTDLIGILAQSRDTDGPTYQLIKTLLERITQLQIILNGIIDEKIDETSAVNVFANKLSTYHTKEDETSVLPNSVQLLAGTGMAFDDSIPNKRTLNVTSGGGGGSVYYAPLTDGNIDETDLIFAVGECIMVPIPL